MTEPNLGGNQALLGPVANNLTITHPELAAQWHPTLNSRSAESVMAHTNYKATWFGCPIDPSHVWECFVSNRVRRGTGCRICPKKSGPPRYKRSLLEVYPEVAKQWHPELNERGPDSWGPNSKKTATWLCAEGHVWKAIVINRTRRKSGCPVCSNRLVLRGYNDISTTHPDLVLEWDHERNALMPTEVHAGSGKPVAWLCASGHGWEVSPQSRSRSGSGCPTCANAEKSKPEQYLREALTSKSKVLVVSSHEESVPIHWKGRTYMRVDVLATARTEAVVPVVVEYDGQYYHSSELSKRNDYEKTMELLRSGIWVVRVREAMGRRQLPLLPIQSPRLLQLEHVYSKSPKAVTWVVGEIDAWLQKELIYPINDGTDKRYPQETPKQRILAYLRALQAGEEMTTEQSMEESFRLLEAEEAATLPADSQPIPPVETPNA